MTADGDGAMTFYLPTLQYFDELPFRLPSASVVLDAGVAAIAGRSYRRLFVTWDRAEPSEVVDQYDVWIDPDTLRIAKVTYTVRDAVARSPFLMRPLMRIAAVGTMHYDDYREIDGVLVPFSQVVTLGTAEATPESLEDSFFHRLILDSASFDSIDPQELQPIDGLPPPGDHKPV